MGPPKKDSQYSLATGRLETGQLSLVRTISNEKENCTFNDCFASQNLLRGLLISFFALIWSGVMGLQFHLSRNSLFEYYWI